jgi:hypothetical protein
MLMAFLGLNATQYLLVRGDDIPGIACGTYLLAYAAVIPGTEMRYIFWSMPIIFLALRVEHYLLVYVLDISGTE